MRKIFLSFNLVLGWKDQSRDDLFAVQIIQAYATGKTAHTTLWLFTNRVVILL